MSNPSLPPLLEPSWPLAELEEIARAAGSLFDASYVWLALRNRHGAIVPMITLTSDGGGFETADPHLLHKFVGAILQPLTGRSATKAPVGITDLHKHKEFVELAGPEISVMRSLAAVTLMDDSAVLGAIVLTCPQTQELSEKRIVMLRMFAQQALTTIRLSAAAGANAAQAAELNATLIASQALTSTLKSEEVFNGIVKSIQDVIECDSALIYRFDEAAGALRIITSLGKGMEGLAGTVTPLDDTKSKAALVARESRSESKPFVGIIGPQEHVGANTNALTAGPNVSLLCMPLISKRRLRGVASLARTRPFTQRDINALARLSPIAAAALENVELYDAEHAARQQQEALFDSASDGFALVDEQLRLIKVNGAFARYFAADSEMMVGQAACTIFSSLASLQGMQSCLLCDSVTHAQCLLRKVIADRASFDHVECALPAPAAHDEARASAGPAVAGREIDFSLTPVQGPEQRAQALMVGRDVSAAREVERVRAQFINMTTHELGTPLQTVSGNIDLFVHAHVHDLPPKHLNWLKTALATANSMETMVADLEVLSKRDAGVWVIDPGPTDIAAEARAALDEMRLNADKKTVRLLPMREEPTLPLAWADHRRVRQVARNLIINAINYTPEGGSVAVSLSYDHQWVQLHVSDTGVGIPAEQTERIWQRYTRVPMPDGSAGADGQGLGLAIVRIIVDAHKGLKAVRSEVGRGTTISISFPRADRAMRQ